MKNILYKRIKSFSLRIMEPCNGNKLHSFFGKNLGDTQYRTKESFPPEILKDMTLNQRSRNFSSRIIRRPVSRMIELLVGR